jgi:hypothetical protein
MAKQYYLPKTDNQKNAWLINFANKLPAYAAMFHITPDEVTDMTKGSVYFDYCINYRNLYINYTRALTSWKNNLIKGKAGALPQPPIPPTAPAAVPVGIFTRATLLAQRIKGHQEFTYEIGKNMGIVGVEHVVDVNKLQPKINLKIVTDKVVVKWQKKGMDALEIWRKIGNEDWQFLTLDMKPHYTDNSLIVPSGSSVVAHYKAIYHQNDERAGQWSNESTISVLG